MSIPVCLVVKRSGRSLAVTNVTGKPQPGRLFHIHDYTCNMRFLVDTGAEVSVIPPSRTDQCNGQGNLCLRAVNGSAITTFGVRSLTLILGLRRTFRWVFIIADVKQPILGADFLSHFGLLVDMQHGTLSDSTTNLQVHGISSTQSSSTGIVHSTSTSGNAFTQVLSEFPDVTQASSKDRPVKHMVMHHIMTTGPPVFARTRRLAPE